MTQRNVSRRPTIGVLAGWQFYWTATPLSYLDPLYRGIRTAASQHGCNLLLGCGMGLSAAPSDPMRPAWPFPSSDADYVPIGGWNTDGLIAVNPLHSQARTQAIQALRAQGHPVVFVGLGEVGPTVAADNAGGIHAAVQHLAHHGHQRIAFIAGSQDDMDGDTGARLHAFHAALAALDLPTDARLLAFGHHTFAGGQAAMQQILATGAPFSALLASNDESALGAMQTLRSIGRRIPEDVAVIGFDDRLESAVQTPPLTSVHLPLFQMGVQAVERLLAQMRGDADLPERIEVRTRLVTRASCGCPNQPELATTPIDPLPLLSLSPASDTEDALARAMSAAVLTEAQTLHAGHAYTYCVELLSALRADAMQPDGVDFEAALQRLLEQTIASGDDAQIWQPAISILRNAYSQMSTPPALQSRIAALLDRARTLIGVATWRQHRQATVGTRWTLDRIGLLTARLLTALDAGEIFAALAQHLPAMQVHAAWFAEFETEDNARVDAAPTWSRLRSITTPDNTEIRFRNTEFPPPPIRNATTPFSLALLPLVGARGQRGYVAFESNQLVLYGAIVQQMAAAFNTAQLYHEATEGRRLAEEANRMKSRFLSTVSHELRTPLNLIVGTSAILLQESDEQRAPLPAQIHHDLERIHGSAQHLAGLIGDVLDLASSDAGRLRLTNEFVDLGQALRVVEEAGRRLAADKGLGWQADIPATGPWVWGDPTRLRQVALNLVNNAVKFTTRGSVSLRVESTADVVTVSVSDTGIGIHPDEQAALFAEFHRTERAIARGYGGLGLGLAISKRLVELHGGAIAVQSSGEEGAGATFSFTLPLANAPAPSASTQEMLAPSGEAAHVLVVTAASPAPAPLTVRLREAGFRVEQTRLDGVAAWLPKLAAGVFHAVVLDLDHTSEAGWRLLKTIKENPATRALPVLFFTATDRQGSLLEVDYLTKPIALTELTRALDQHWGAPAAIEHGRTILVVDDDPETLDLHARIVQTHSAAHRVLRAANGREALEILRRTAVDLMLLDLMMPDVDGFAVLETMRAQAATRDVPVIVVTGQTLSEAEIDRLNQGVATILRKGLYSLDETLAHLEAALARRRKLSQDAQRLVRRAMAFLHAHYAEPLTRQEIARHVGLDEDYLTYCFRQELGLTPIAYLNRYRVNQAKELLRRTDKSITTVALEVGFADSGYFSRIFRREVGLSPDAYRRST
ncbi:MAG TPA: substrate-binding domain-containing protein [Chloroflexi bacterium]|nr:substrate-binding domain-containing protein [Chloroflexota bacterium]